MNKNQAFDNPLGLSEKIIKTILDHQSNEEMKKVCSVIKFTDDEVEDFNLHMNRLSLVLLGLQEITYPSISTEKMDQEELEELEELARKTWLYMRNLENKLFDAWEKKEKQLAEAEG
tara:strand:- start:1293 stop:1643 length:351 start_codon:yes stop_codon:yes gene_type:complete